VLSTILIQLKDELLPPHKINIESIPMYANKAEMLKDVERVLKETADKPVRKRKSKR
jgi:hypothetical protein